MLSSHNGVSAEDNIKLRGKGPQESTCAQGSFSTDVGCGLDALSRPGNTSIPPPSSQRPLTESINCLILHSYRVARVHGGHLGMRRRSLAEGIVGDLQPPAVAGGISFRKTRSSTIALQKNTSIKAQF